MSIKNTDVPTPDESRVLRAQQAKGSIAGVRYLAAHAWADTRKSQHVRILRDCLRATRSLSSRGHVDVSKSGRTVTISLTTYGRAQLHGNAASVAMSRATPLITAAIGTVALAGCSLLNPKPEPVPVYQATAIAPMQAVQVQLAPAQGREWTYCEANCPGPTPKSFPREDLVRVKAVAPPPPPPPPSKAPITVTLSADVLFDFDRATLSEDGRQVIANLGADLKREGATKVTILGFTDRIGTDTYNLKLSQRRADSVKEHLVRITATATIDATGRGKEDPVTGAECQKRLSPAKLRECLQPDRRVEISITQTSPQ